MSFAYQKAQPCNNYQQFSPPLPPPKKNHTKAKAKTQTKKHQPKPISELKLDWTLLPDELKEWKREQNLISHRQAIDKQHHLVCTGRKNHGMKPEGQGRENCRGWFRRGTQQEEQCYEPHISNSPPASAQTSFYKAPVATVWSRRCFLPAYANTADWSLR